MGFFDKLLEMWFNVAYDKKEIGGLVDGINKKNAELKVLHEKSVDALSHDPLWLEFLANLSEMTDIEVDKFAKDLQDVHDKGIKTAEQNLKRQRDIEMKKV